ncbi:MAG: twin-arginine translocase subunit TatB [Sutterella wadsworthensis]|nr:twin-arginine translocase subunit TatB [Sutterella wadsworthensis]
MFDFGFSEMLVIGTIALVVLGPERLPTVARTAGEWIGKAQRFVAQVKSDINRETELAELKRIQDEAKALANDVKSTVEKSASAIEKDVQSVSTDTKEAVTQAQDSLKEIEESVNKMASAGSSDEIADFYGWGDSQESSTAAEPMYKWEEPKTFTKRYHAGPSVDELAQEIAKLRRELGMRDAQLGGNNRRLAARARTNRPRIYR